MERAAGDNAEDLYHLIGSGAAEATTHPKWHMKWGSVVPVSGVNMSDEPMVIRQGHRVATGTKLQADNVARVDQQGGASIVYADQVARVEWTKPQHGVPEEEIAQGESFVKADHEETEMKAREEGTMLGEMIKDVEHKAGDWRRGKSCGEIIEGTKEESRNREYLEWRYGAN